MSMTVEVCAGFLQAEAAALEPAPAGQKKGRGRPKGSKTKPKPEEQLEPAATAADGVRQMLDSKKLSSKINYDNIKNLFSSGAAEPPKRSAAPFLMLLSFLSYIGYAVTPFTQRGSLCIPLLQQSRLHPSRYVCKIPRNSYRGDEKIRASKPS